MGIVLTAVATAYSARIARRELRNSASGPAPSP